MKTYERPILLIILGSLTSTVCLSGVAPVARKEPSTDRSWAFIYYMSYDNNLDYWTERILHDLADGVRSPRVTIVVQADRQRSEGMRRIVLSNKGGQVVRKEVPVSSDDSADEAELEKFLQWVRDDFPASKYVVTFLNHGGTLNNMCLDEHPGGKSDEPTKWLEADRVGRVLSEFNKSVEGRVGLLFLQQCGRGSIENLYNFAESAEYILSSPFSVGAPNTYYTEVLAAVSANVTIEVVDLARLIMQRDEHYYAYTLVSAEALRELPGRLDSLLRLFDGCVDGGFQDDLLETFRYGGEVNYDVESVFRGLSRGRGDVVNRGVESFLTWYNTSLTVSKGLGPWSGSNHRQSSGLSIFLPSSEEDLARYEGLPLYQEVDLEKFFRWTWNMCGGTRGGE